MAALVAAALVIVSATAALAAVGPVRTPRLLRPVLPGSHPVTVQMRRAGARYKRQRALVATNVVLARRAAKLRGQRLAGGYSQRVSRWSIARLAHANAHLRHQIARLSAPAPSSSAGGSGAQTPTISGGPGAGKLAAIAQCESGGNPRAVGGGGTYRGLYQFDQQAWQSVGGSGDPAAASPAEQTKRAAMLYASRGSSPWPVCGK
jgi:hypothetical protein